MEDAHLLVATCGTMLQQALQDNKFHFAVAPSGHEAEAMLNGSAYTAALFELESDVAESLSGLKQLLAVVGHPPVVVITDHTDPVCIAYLLSLGVFGVLAKPLKCLKLKELTQAALELGATDRLRLVSVVPWWLEIAFPAQHAYISRLSSFLEFFIFGLPEQDAKRLIYAVRELVQNAIEHGSHFCADKQVVTRYIKSSTYMIFQIEDEGPGFNINDLPHAIGHKKNAAFEVTRFRKHCGMRPGGLGISTILTIADELVYNQKGNAVTMIKCCSPKPTSENNVPHNQQ